MTEKPLQIKTVWRRIAKAKTDRDWEVAKKSIERLGSPDDKVTTGVTLLMMAARTGNVKAVELLLSLGADPNQTDKEVGTPRAGHCPVLGYALLRYDALERGHISPEEARVKREAVVKALLMAGANPQGYSLWERGCECGAGMANLFLDYGAGDLQGLVPIQPGDATLFDGVLQGIWFSCHMECEAMEPWKGVIERLIEKGHSLNERDHEGKTAWQRFMDKTPRVNPLYNDTGVHSHASVFAQLERMMLDFALTSPDAPREGSRLRL